MSVKTLCEVAWEYHARRIPVALKDVEAVIAEACTPGDSGYAEEDVVGLFLLNDGRFLYVTGGCDTTGWDCQSGASGEIRNTLEDLIRECCTDEDRKRLTSSSDRCFLHEDCWVHAALARACRKGRS